MIQLGVILLCLFSFDIEDEINEEDKRPLSVFHTFRLRSSALCSLCSIFPARTESSERFGFQLMDWHAEIGHQGERPRLFRPTAVNFPDQSLVRCNSELQSTGLVLLSM